MAYHLLRTFFPNLFNRIEQQPSLGIILRNISWLFFDRFLKTGVGLVVGVWVARYLGPEQFGLMSYALAFVALFSAIAGLGLNGIAVRDMVRDPAEANITMGTAFVLQFIGGICAFVLAALIIRFIRPDDGVAKLSVAILSFVMVFKAADVVRYWFEAQVQSKYIVWAENFIVILISAVKIGLIFLGAPLMAFIWALFIEGGFLSVGLFAVYELRGGKIKSWRISLNRARDLLSNSWQLILASVAILAYMRIDQIMLGQMAGDDSVGIYSAAVKISEAWYFIPTVIASSVFPAIIEAKKQGEKFYLNRLQKLYNVVVVLALTVAILMTFLSSRIVAVLFGPMYEQAGPVLAAHIWAGVFVSLGVASGKWLIIENLQKYALYRALLGAVVNIGLNLFMIPKYGVNGAAYATVISYAIAGMFFDLLPEKTRSMFIMKVRSFNIFKTAVLIRK